MSLILINMTKNNASFQNINDLSSPFKNLMRRYYQSLGSYRKVDKLSQIIKSYVLKNFTKKNALIGDDPNDYLPEELNHLKKSFNFDFNKLNHANTSDQAMPDHHKLNQTGITIESNKQRTKEKNIRESRVSCSIINRSEFSITHSKANHSLIIRSSSLLPILSSQRNGINDNRSHNEKQLIQSKIRDNIERNIRKKRRVYDYQYDRLISKELSHPSSLKLFRTIKMKYPLKNIQNNISKIEDSISDSYKQVKANIHEFHRNKVFFDKRLTYLLSKHKEN